MDQPSPVKKIIFIVAIIAALAVSGFAAAYIVKIVSGDGSAPAPAGTKAK